MKPGAHPIGAIAPAIAEGNLDGRPILFNEERQRIFELNGTAAYLWQCLRRGMDAGSLQRELEAEGVEAQLASSWVRSAVRAWQKAGLILPKTSHRRSESRIIEMAGVVAEIHFVDALTAPMEEVFPQHAPRCRRPDIIVTLSQTAGGVRFYRNGVALLECAADEALPTLRAHLLDEILDRSRYEIALHAASLARDGRMLLVCGTPGAGKTTLALALDSCGAGFHLSGDDVALIGLDGGVSGVPLPAAVKSGAWKILAARRSDLAGLSIHRRADGRRVRFVAAKGPPPPSAPAGWIAFLHRRQAGGAAIVPVSKVEAMRRLLAGAYAPGGRLAASSFGALSRTVEGAAAFELHYTRLDDGMALLAEVCR